MLQTLRNDIPSQSEQMTPWTDRTPLKLGETPSEKYVKTDLSNFSYPLLGAIEYGVLPNTPDVAAPSNSNHAFSVVSSSLGSNPYDFNTYQDGKTASAQLLFKF